MSDGRIQPEMIVGLSAVFIGVCALAVSVYETQLMREEQRASVLPILELSRSYYISEDAENRAAWRMSFQVENVGIGPARVLDFSVTVDGEPQNDWRTAIRELIGRDVLVAYGQSTINGRTIPPERQVTMFDLTNTELAHDIKKEIDRLDFTACFCSVYDECWITSYSAFGGSTPVEQCVASEASFTD